jgi:hypothetical protein
MEIPKFIGDKDKYEINPVEWMRMVKEHCKNPFHETINFYGEAYK